MALQDELAKQGNWLFRNRSYLPLLFLPPLGYALWRSGGGFTAPWYRIACLGISFLGLAIRAYTVGHVPGSTSGRNVDRQIAAHLNVTGTYSLMRHPLYFGNMLIYLGVALVPGIWWYALLVFFYCLLYYERIILAEEAFLNQEHDERWLAWAARTPALFPKPSLWRRSEWGFCPRTVLRREYSGYFAIVLMFALVVHLQDWLREGALRPHVGWTIFLLASLAIYLTLRTLKHRTRLLHVDGR